MGFLGGLVGGLAGLASGGPLGAVAGLAGGLFGDKDNPRQVSTVQLRALTAGEKEMLGLVETLAPGLMQSLSPEQQKQLIDEFSAMYKAEAMKEIETTFGQERGRAKLDLARTGQGPGSVVSSQLAEIGKREADAKSSASLQARLAGEQVGANRVAANQGALSTLLGIMNSIRGNQQIGAGQTVTTAGGTIPEALSIMAGASVSPYSWINNKNPTVFGVPLGWGPPKQEGEK